MKTEAPTPEPANRAGPTTDRRPKAVRRFPRTRADEADVSEFLAPVRQVAESQPSPILLRLILVIGAMVTFAVVLAYFGRIDVYAVAPGRVVPIGRSKAVQSLIQGRVAHVLVHDGSHVVRGQLLVQLDSTILAANQQALSDQVHSIQAELVRQQAEVGKASNSNATPLTFPAGVPAAMRTREVSTYLADMASYRASLEVVRSRVSAAHSASNQLAAVERADRSVYSSLTKLASARRQLALEGWDSQASAQSAEADASRQSATIDSALAQVAAETANAATAAADLNQTRAAFIAEHARAAASLQQHLEETKDQLIKATSSLEEASIRSPETGTVQEMNLTGQGLVVNSGQQMMLVVPSGVGVEVEALVHNTDIGFIKTGQSVVLKVETFPYTQYGVIEGFVSRVYRDAVPANEMLPQNDTAQHAVEGAEVLGQGSKTQDLVYPVTISIPHNRIVVDGVVRQLRPGMSLSAEIRTDRRRVITFLLSPLVKAIAEAGHDR